MQKVAITGATGFVGLALTRELCHIGHDVVALVRAPSKNVPAGVTQVGLGDFSTLAGNFRDSYAEPVLSRAEGGGMSEGSDVEQLISTMQGIDVVIHTAARTHVMKEEHEDPAAIYHLMNVALTEKLALAAANAGVKRFVFISSIKVNGESTGSCIPIPTFSHQEVRSKSAVASPSPLEGEGACKPFTESDSPNPQDLYAISKWQAEQKLIEIGQETGMQIVILRPPLIYGPGVKGNFASLIKLVSKGIPLPFGTINNRRSLLALDNLISAILLVSKHPAAADQTFLLADDEVVSTTQLIKLIAQAQGKKARLIPVPMAWMKFVAGLLGKKAVADRLFGSLEIDTRKIREQLGWQPAVTMKQQLEETA